MTQMNVQHVRKEDNSSCGILQGCLCCSKYLRLCGVAGYVDGVVGDSSRHPLCTEAMCDEMERGMPLQAGNLYQSWISYFFKT